MKELERPIDPPQMKASDEMALDVAIFLLAKVSKLHDKAESFFEELTVNQLEDIWTSAEFYLEQLEEMYGKTFAVKDEYNIAKYKVEDIEGWFHEKEDSIKNEDK